MSIEVCGGKKVKGALKVQGSKNAVLPVIAAAAMCDGITEIHNCPDITDVHAMADVLREIGGDAVYDRSSHCLTINPAGISPGSVRAGRGGEIRASVLFLGSMLSRFGRAEIVYPGGCSIGDRPIDFHLRAFQEMGARTWDVENRVCCEAERLRGAEICLDYPSVGATENILLAAVLAEGATWIRNAAREPEIAELCCFLRQAGAVIQGDGTEHILVQGVPRLRGLSWRMKSDRIVFLTYALMVAGCGGEAFLELDGGVPPVESAVLLRTGCEVEPDVRGARVCQHGRPKAIPYICTRPYPGFPTDGQSLLMAVLCKSGGVSMIEESVFENRFRMISKLRKMGANIDFVSNHACITGVTKLHGADVEADDLRSGAGLLIAACMAESVTHIRQERYIHRGYEDIAGHMRQLGLRVQIREEKERGKGYEKENTL